MGSIIVGLLNEHWEGMVHADHIDSKRPGFAVEVTRLICDQLNVNCNFVALNTSYGRLENGSWTGMLQDLLNEEINTTVPLYTLPEFRDHWDKFDHSQIVFKNPLMFLTRSSKSESIFAFHSLAGPFSSAVWLLIVLAIILSIVNLASIERQRNSPIARVTILAILVTIGFLVRKGSNLAVKFSPVAQLFLMFWGYTTVILTTSYASGLISAMLRDPYKSPFSGIQSLARCLEAKKCRFVFTPADEWFTDMIQDKNTTYHLFQQSFITNPPFYTSDDNYLNVIKETKDIFMVAGTTSYTFYRFIQYDPAVQLIEDDSGTDNCYFPFRLGDPLKKRFDEKLKLLQQSGVIKYIASKYDLYDNRSYSGPQGRFVPIRLSFALATCTILLFGLTVSSFVFMSEINEMIRCA